MTWKSPANKLGHAHVEVGDNGDNLSIVLCCYFEDHSERPENDPTDDETGQGKWVMEKTLKALELIAEQLT
jgi:hypothetical protein